jgi:hypothetical protein
MRSLLPILALLAGLGCSISFAQFNQQIDPFQRYLAGLQANRQEAALVRFASECGVDIKGSARYAQRPGSRWVLVKDLSKALEDQETDFYGVAAVWHQADRIVVEEWSMELDTGDYTRSFFCFKDQKIRIVETIDWSISVEGWRKENPAWGYEHRWKIGQDGKYENVLHRFVNLSEEPMAAPKLDAEVSKGLDWSPMVATWEDMKMPAESLR